jgi:hypothetical protein
MATRMQQRRGTAAQWTAANPILAAGEIGFETDTSKFKMGNGSSTWSALQYFANAAELAAIVDGAPGLLDTLNELAASIGDDANFVGTVTAHTTATTNVHGIANTALLATTAGLNAAIGVAQTAIGADITSAISGAAADATTKANAALTAAGNALSDHNIATLNVHGIADTALLATKAYANTAAESAEDAAALDATTKANAAVTTAGAALTDHNLDTSNVHGIADTSLLATKAYADQAEIDAVAEAVAQAAVDATTKAGNAKTEAITEAGTAADDKISTHNLDETNVHGIADTSVLVTQTDLTNAINSAEVDQSTLAGTGLEWDGVNTQFDLDETHITTATQTALDLKAPKADPTFTGTVSGITKTMVGLGNVDNTSDANKPVSTATQTALDAKASLAGATFTGSVEIDQNLVVDGNLTVNGTQFNASSTSIVIEDNMIQLAHQNAANTVDLGLVVGYNDGANKHAGLVRDVSDAKWKLFKGVTTEPSTTVDFTQGSLDDLKVAAFEATTVTASSGIVFSDGTQTKVGVPSVTTFATAISSSATLAAGEADKFVPLTGAVTITLPATGYSTGQSIDFYQASGTGAQFSSANSTVGTPGLKFRTTNSVVTAMKTAAGWLVFGDLSA